MTDKPKPTIEELVQQLEQHSDFADRHSADIKLKTGAVWRIHRIRIADKEVANR